MAEELEIKASWKGVISDCLWMLVGIGLITILFKIPEIISTKIVITPKSVTGKTGILRRQNIDEPIRQISSVKVDQNLLGQICNYGTLIINSTNGTIAFRYISDPNKVKSLITKLVDRQR